MVMEEEKAFQTLKTASIKVSDCQVLRKFEGVRGLVEERDFKRPKRK